MIVFIFAIVGVLLQVAHLIFVRLDRRSPWPNNYSTLAVLSIAAAALAFAIATAIVLLSPDGGNMLVAALLTVACCGALLMLTNSEL